MKTSFSYDPTTTKKLAYCKKQNPQANYTREIMKKLDPEHSEQYDYYTGFGKEINVWDKFIEYVENHEDCGYKIFEVPENAIVLKIIIENNGQEFVHCRRKYRYI